MKTVSAEQVLLKCGAETLPIDPAELAERCGVKIVSYGSCARVYDTDMEGLYKTSRYGFGFYAEGRYVCAVNENACGEARRRWTMAHELAHFFLGHLDVSPRAGAEREADEFAASLLAPMVVLHFCGVGSPEEIQRLCAISRQAAEIRFAELCECRRAAGDRLRSLERRPTRGICLETAESAALLTKFAPFVGRYIAERTRHDGYGDYIRSAERVFRVGKNAANA